MFTISSKNELSHRRAVQYLSLRGGYRSRENKDGFTALEILISSSILIVIVTLSITSFWSARNTRDLTTSTQNVSSVLKLAQSKTLAGEDNLQWGVRLTNSDFILFRGATFAGGTPVQTFVLPSNIEIMNVVLIGGGQDVIFNRLTGNTVQSGTFDVRIRGGTNTISLVVAPSGKVYETGSVPAPTGRVVDTRHRSFNLGWSIQGAVTLTLTFSNPPNPDTITTITPLTSYFNAGQTKFDWTGSVSVGGQNQTLRIHTTFLGATNTTLSIDRDCRRNTKQVRITIDGKDIATYSADCQTVTVGPFGGTISEP